MATLSRAVFLDRDGVINDAIVRNGKPYSPRCLAELTIQPEVPACLEALKRAGFCTVVVTNQPDVARGLLSAHTLELINSKIVKELPIDLVKTCTHDTGHMCVCRKPSPGSIFSAAKELGIDLLKSYLVGDRSSDIEAGRRAKCTTIFIDYAYEESPPDVVDYRVSSFAEATRLILSLNP